MRTLRYLTLWVPLALAVGVMAGAASALLLISLAWATEVRESHRWLIALLPLAGFAVGCMYHLVGRPVERGTSLILEEIRKEGDDPRHAIPLRMTPLILVGTFLTHLFGGSAGREGTALQTGASLADQFARPLKLDTQARRILLMAGISGGFASVFGTPVAGAVFGLEIVAGFGFKSLRSGSTRYEAIVPCLLAAFAGDGTTRALHVVHTVYPRVLVAYGVNAKWLLLAAFAGIFYGLAARAFSFGVHGAAQLFQRIRFAPLRPAVGGAIVAAAVFMLGTTRYIGLGIPTILDSFSSAHRPWDFAAKIAFTVATLGSGFKGGEVTPLFFIGATLGNALSHLLALPVPLLAAMGFAAVFGGASKTPIASTLMAMELFGGEVGAYAAVACLVSSLCAGKQGIYKLHKTQRPQQPRETPVNPNDGDPH